jgi:flagellin
LGIASWDVCDANDSGLVAQGFIILSSSADARRNSVCALGAALPVPEWNVVVPGILWLDRGVGHRLWRRYSRPTERDTDHLANRRPIMTTISRLAAEPLLAPGPKGQLQPSAPASNDEKLRADAMKYLRPALAAAELRIAQHFGLKADGAKIQIKLDGTFASGVMAYVQGRNVPGSDPRNTNITMHFNMDYYASGGRWKAGKVQYFDRIVAHELTHAVMFRSISWDKMGSNSKWFTEGTAEFIHGGDARLLSDLKKTPGGAATLAKRVDDNNYSYSAGYAAVKYLHYKIRDAYRRKGINPGTRGIRDLISLMKYPGPNMSLSQALATLAKRLGGPMAEYTSNEKFLADFKRNGAAFINRLNLTNADTGAVGGQDSNGGPVRTAETVVIDRALRPANDPLRYFTERFA